jgi:hypothetical protein
VGHSLFLWLCKVQISFTTFSFTRALYLRHRTESTAGNTFHNRTTRELRHTVRRIPPNPYALSPTPCRSAFDGRAGGKANRYGKALGLAIVLRKVFQYYQHCLNTAFPRVATMAPARGGFVALRPDSSAEYPKEFPEYRRRNRTFRLEIMPNPPRKASRFALGDTVEISSSMGNSSTVSKA